jgi:hypothetical protein
MIAADFETGVRRLHDLVNDASVILPFTGAGFSTECGIPDSVPPRRHLDIEVLIRGADAGIAYGGHCPRRLGPMAQFGLRDSRLRPPSSRVSDHKTRMRDIV